MRRQGPERDALPQVFVSLAQNPASRNVGLFIRASSDDPLALAGAVQAAVARVEKNAPVSGVAPLEQQLGSYLTQRRFQTSLATGFSIVALLMAAVGIYGLIQYSIATRTREIGLRMAIGAQPGDIFRMIIGEGLTLSLTGVAIGLVGAWWLGRAGSSLLFGVTASDPLTFATVSLLLTAVAVAACYFPARRAMRGGSDTGVAGVLARRARALTEVRSRIRIRRGRTWCPARGRRRRHPQASLNAGFTNEPLGLPALVWLC